MVLSSSFPDVTEKEAPKCACVCVHMRSHIWTKNKEADGEQLSSSGPGRRGKLANNELVPLESEGFFLKKLGR